MKITKEIQVPQVHGHDKHTDVTRELFIPPAGATDGTIISRGYQLADGALKYGSFIFMVPDDFVSFVKAEVIWYSPAAAGNMYWGINAYYAGSGENYNQNTEYSLAGTSATAGWCILNFQQPPNGLTLAALQEGDCCMIYVYRDSTNALDTLGDWAVIKGLLITYTAEQ